MRKDLIREIEIPSGVEVAFDGNEVTVKGNGKEIKKSFNFGKVKGEVSTRDDPKGPKDGIIILSAKGASRRESKMIGTINARLNNMIKGVGEDFVYSLEICNVHFPMTVKVEGDTMVIKSFLGEKKDRFAKILPGANVDIKGTQITVSSHDIDLAGQTSANIEKATRLKGRDRRIFQDGIFITEKPGRVI